MNDAQRPSIGARIMARLRTLLSERLAPGQAAAAVFLGVSLGIIPIYGAQSIVAIALASVLRLNRPLTLAATFINNPLLQPFLVVGSFELGHRALHGTWTAITPSALLAGSLKGQLAAFFLGSVFLAILLATPCAAMAYLALAWRRRQQGEGGAAARDGHAAPAGRSSAADRRRFSEEVGRRYAGAATSDRSFVWWKVRLDRIFDILLREDLGTGAAVDLGCGYGLALLVAEVQRPGRRLVGCDLDSRRIATARAALSNADCSLSVADAAVFDLPPADVVLIIDVLQYFDRPSQCALIARCCRALEPGGRLIFRVPETRRAWTTATTRWLDRAVFGLGRTKARPTHLPASDYRRWLEDLGLSVTERHLGNRLPLSHVLFVARKPGVQADA